MPNTGFENPHIQQSKDRFYIGEDPSSVHAQLIFEEKDEHTLIAVSTQVDETLQGQGVAGRLLEALVQYARQNNKKIVPQCSYVAKKFKENPDLYSDVNAEA